MFRVLTSCLAAAALLAAAPAQAVTSKYPQATLRGFPDLSDEHGVKIADGVLTQWIEKEKLHIRLTWDFPSGRHVEEQAILRQHPELAQETWSFEDKTDGQVMRRFDIDFGAGRATGHKIDDKGKPEEWSEEIKVKPGKTFAGIAFGMAAAAVYDQLKAGEKIELEGVVFMPKPRVGGVELSLEGVRPLRRGGKALSADVIKLHPKVPWPVNKIVGARDIRLWYFHGAPPQLMRAEMPMAEIKDPMVRIDVLPGGKRLARPSARAAK